MATQKIFEAPIGDGSDDEEPRVAVAHVTWKGTHFALFAGENLVGKDEQCDVVLDHASISSKHASIDIDEEDKRVIVKDLRSSNHTWVEQTAEAKDFVLVKPRQKVELKDGCSIRFGNVTAKFVFAPPPRIADGGKDAKAKSGSAESEWDVPGDSDDDGYDIYDAETQVIDAPGALPKPNGVTKTALPPVVEEEPTQVEEEEEATEEEEEAEEPAAAEPEAKAEEEEPTQVLDDDGEETEQDEEEEAPAENHAVTRQEEAEEDAAPRGLRRENTHDGNTWAIPTPAVAAPAPAPAPVPARQMDVDSGSDTDVSEDMLGADDNAGDGAPNRAATVRTIPLVIEGGSLGLDAQPLPRTTAPAHDVDSDDSNTDLDEPPVQRQASVATSEDPASQVAAPQNPESTARSRYRRVVESSDDESEDLAPARPAPEPVKARVPDVQPAAVPAPPVEEQKQVEEKTEDGSDADTEVEMEMEPPAEPAPAFAPAAPEPQPEPQPEAPMDVPQEVVEPAAAVEPEPEPQPEPEPAPVARGKRPRGKAAAAAADDTASDEGAANPAKPAAKRGRKSQAQAAAEAEPAAAEEKQPEQPAAKSRGGKRKAAAAAAEPVPDVEPAAAPEPAEEAKTEPAPEAEAAPKQTRRKGRQSAAAAAPAVDAPEEKKEEKQEKPAEKKGRASGKGRKQEQPAAEEPQAAAPTPKRGRQRATASQEDIRIVFTGVQPSAEDLAAVETIGGTHVATPQEATHMIAQSVAHKVPLKRTPKLLMGINRCKYVLDLRWLTESAANGRALDPAPYIVHDRAAEQKWGFSMRTSLERAQSGIQPFAGWSVYVTPEVCGKSAPPSEETQEIVEAAGGQWLAELPAGGDLGWTIVFSSEAALKLKKVKNMLPDILPRCANRRVYAFELLLLTVLRQELNLDAEETQQHVLIADEAGGPAAAAEAPKRARGSRKA